MAYCSIVVKDALLEAHPWLAKSLYEAFVQSKQAYLNRLNAGKATDPTDLNYVALSRIVGDPLPYGVADNLPAIKALILYGAATQKQLDQLKEGT